MRRRARFLLLSLALLLPACLDKGPTNPTAASLAGNWNLQSINDHALPYTMSQVGNDTYECLSGQMSLTADRTFHQSAIFRTTRSGVAVVDTTNNDGSYTLDGFSMVFTFSDGSTGPATANGNTITLGVPGFLLMFLKQ